MTTQQDRAVHLLGKAARTAQRGVNRAVRAIEKRESVGKRPGTSARPTVERLSPREALRENGFTVYRNMFPADECARLAATFKGEAKITEGKKFTKVDSVNFFPTAGEMLLEGRILDAVRMAIGPDARFLQVSDLHYRHDTFNWHRDSVHRAQDSSAAPDWNDPAESFGIVKAILYMEAENAAMGIMAGSHLSPLAMDFDAVKGMEARGEQIVVGPEDEVNRRFTPEEKRHPLAWKAQVGDLLVFDQRMYHGGRRVEGNKVVANQEAPKFTLSLVFGVDNHHSERMYSYFRYAREELHYRDLSEPIRDALDARGMTLAQGWGNYYEQHPAELRLVYLPDAAKMDDLVDRFAKAGSAHA